MGIDVTCVYFTRCLCNKQTAIPDDSNPWIKRLAEVGVDFVPAESGKIRELSGISGSIIVSFCNQHALHNWPEFHALGCRFVWSPCMTYTTRDETKAFSKVPPTVVHFQSRFQANKLSGEYALFGCRQFRMIHGAFDPLPLNPRPHVRGEPFVVGRLARPCRTKWSPNLWGILSKAREQVPSLKALCMAWTPEIELHVGKRPEWATCLPENLVSTREFLSQCHVLICLNYCVEENWPRIGLEAMSAGVALIADHAGGWIEQSMNRAAILCKTPEDYANAIVTLAEDDELRLQWIHAGRKRVEEIADVAGLSAQWDELFDSVGRRTSQQPLDTGQAVRVSLSSS
jgi:hypothetical protein